MNRRLLNCSISLGLGFFLAVSLVDCGTANNQTLQAEHIPQTTRQPHPLPNRLGTWIPKSDESDYFDKIMVMQFGYLIWSDRPVSVYVAPSHFTDLPRKKLWNNSARRAIAQWKPYFPLQISADPNADIVIEQTRPKKMSNGRARSAQATPAVFCGPNQVLTLKFLVQVSPSQTHAFIRSAIRHELGHALGIWGHSDNPNDVMYESQVRQPPPISERDINTLKRIYQQSTELGRPAPKYCPPQSVQE